MAHPRQSHVTPVREIELLQRQLDDRDATIRDLRDQVADLRTQRDRESKERRALTAQLLTYRQRRPWRRR